MDPGRVERQVCQQGLGGLPGVAVRVVGGHEALVAEPHVDPVPVDTSDLGGPDDALVDLCGDRATGQGHGRHPAVGLDPGEGADQLGRNGRCQLLR